MCLLTGLMETEMSTLNIFIQISWKKLNSPSRSATWGNPPCWFGYIGGSKVFQSILGNYSDELITMTCLCQD